MQFAAGGIKFTHVALPELLPQSAAAAEHFTVAFASALMRSGTKAVVVADCLAVVLGAAKHPFVQLH